MFLTTYFFVLVCPDQVADFFDTTSLPDQLFITRDQILRLLKFFNPGF